MRWFWVDRFIDFKSGRSARAVKCVSLAEEHVHDHFPGYPTHPQSLMIEGMAQTGGVLVGEACDFREKVILAKINRAKFHRLVLPGDQIVYNAEVVDEIRPEGASIRGTITRGDELIAEIELMFVHLDQNITGEDFGDDNFVFSSDFVKLLRMRSLAAQFADNKGHEETVPGMAGANADVNVKERPVVISGCGLLTPLGSSVDEVFRAACQGRSATSLAAPFDTSAFGSRVVGVLPQGTDLYAGMRKDQIKYFRKNTKVMSRDIQLAVASVGRAVTAAGLPLGEPGHEDVLPTIDHARFGIIYGAGFTPVELPEMAATLTASLESDGSVSMKKWGRDGLPLAFPLWLLKYLPNMLACHIGIIWDCQGPSNSITCNDASGLLALGEAFRHLARGTADIMLTGAAETKVHPSSMLRHYLLKKATTAYNERPEIAQRPFDLRRDGYVCAEGSVALVVESADHAAKRRHKPLATIAGFGSSCSAMQPNVPEISGRSIALAIRAALKDSGLKPADIDAVIAQGSAVVEQDIGEATAIREVLGDVPVTTFSGGMGNIGCTAGQVNVALACKMMAEGCIPPIRNCDEIDPRCPIKVVTGSPLSKTVNTVLVLSEAISGQTAAMVLRKA